MPSARQHLRLLLEVHTSYGPGLASKKLAALRALVRAPLPSAREVLSLHEALCFLRAYPDDADVLALAEEMLAGFARRADLRKHRRALADSGIAGTTLAFSFFASPALRLAQRWGSKLRLDWPRFDQAPRLAALLPLLTPMVERAAFDDHALTSRQWVRRFKGAGETDASFLIKRWHALEAAEPIRSALYDELDPPLVLAPGSDTPCRTREKIDCGPVHFQSRPLVRVRPDLARELRMRPSSVRHAKLRVAAQLIELARDAMLPRERDLEVFAYGNEHDVRVIDAGDGLRFVRIGVIPERRSVLEAVVGFLMLKNGVAVGYALCSALFRSSEIAFNVFETFRSGETAVMFGRLLSVVHQQFGSTSFAIDPYQLGHGNDEGLRSGAFWFYQKLGFRPRDGEVAALLDRELRTMREVPGHRSSRATLQQLSRAYVLWSPGKARNDVLGVLSPSRVARRVSALVAEQFGANRELGERIAMERARALLGVAPARFRALSLAERQAFARWSPLVMCLDVSRWTVAEKRGLAQVMIAKGGPSEDEFVSRFERHARLRRGLVALAC